MTDVNAKPLPEFWTTNVTVEGTRLTHAIRGGKSQWFMVALGSAILFGAVYFLQWLLVGTGGDLTIFGWIFLLLPVGVGVFGVYVLDIALLARTHYTLGARSLIYERKSVFQKKRVEIARDSITSLSQDYSPPGDSQPQGHPGYWTTFVGYKVPPERKERFLAIDGVKSEEEARWLGPMLVKWSGVKMKRGFASGWEEADPAELPEL